jgi:hypothetical protein
MKCALLQEIIIARAFPAGGIRQRPRLFPKRPQIELSAEHEQVRRHPPRQSHGRGRNRNRRSHGFTIRYANCHCAAHGMADENGFLGIDRSGSRQRLLRDGGALLRPCECKGIAIVAMSREIEQVRTQAVSGKIGG